MDKKQKIAFVFSPYLGDSLISMVVVNNLRNNGYDVEVFSDYMFELRRWFPWATIHSYLSQDNIRSQLSTYDTLMFLFESDVIAVADNADQWHPNIIAFSAFVHPDKRKKYIKIKGPHLIESLMELGQKSLYLNNLISSNGMVYPPTLSHHKYFRRIIIHPTSQLAYRSWSKPKFIQLAKKLQKLGYEPNFIVSPKEKPQWVDIQQNDNLALSSFSSLDELAVYIYESAWFLGNDSGIGHLASSLGLPTITLAARPSLARTWRPYWCDNAVITPNPLLISKYLKEKFWQHFTSVNRVFRTIMKQPWVKP
jgi:hypothetical protein